MNYELYPVTSNLSLLIRMSTTRSRKKIIMLRSGPFARLIFTPGEPKTPPRIQL